MRRKPHVRFGGRAEETDQPKRWHRASVRSNHSYATSALAQGVPVKVNSQRIGHAGVTLKVYAYVMPGDDEAAAAAADRLFTRS